MKDEKSVKVENPAWQERLALLFKQSMTVLLAVMSAAGVFIRTIQYMYFIDSRTGFYQKGDITHWILYILIAVFFLLLCAGAFLDRRRYTLSYTEERFSLLWKVSAVLAVAMVAQGVFDLFGQFFADPIPVLGLLRSILLICSGAAFGMQAFKFKNQKVDGKNLDILYIFPIIWAAFRLGEYFLENTMVVNVSENLFAILYLAFVLIFLLTSCKIYARLDSQKTIRYMLVSGAMTVVCGFMRTIPKYVLFLFMGERKEQPPLIDLVLSLYALILVFALLQSRTPLEETEEVLSVPEADAGQADE
ncbi:MAG TPA: hypothetical protein H9671_00675 [Firmicutes bacterium]|nr:hypothetical protein [Bacillota bacterium]